MQVIADLQLHSKFAQAVSKNMTLEEISRWSKIKGLDLVATGDWTHPLWLAEIKDKLQETEEGIFKLKNSGEGAFFLSSEVSCVYRQEGKYHGIHLLVFAPSIQTVESINRELLKRGQNLSADGRPRLSLSPREVTELVLEVNERCLIIPAHSWTPWFGYFGEHGGFNSIEEGFGDLAQYIYAIETGLGSDPAMNWRIADLNGRNIVSFSDAHSPIKIGREATVFEIPDNKLLSYGIIREAIISRKSPEESPRIAYTIEFYPQEGKYHYTGHRKCRVCLSPEEVKLKGLICPACGKRLTVGAMQRVEEMGRPKIAPKFVLDGNGVRWLRHPEEKRPPYVMLVPLQEILSEALEVGVGSKKVLGEYERLVGIFGSELEILLKTGLDQVIKTSGERVGEAIKRVRTGEIVIPPGYDGLFGKVKIWKDRQDQIKLL